MYTKKYKVSILRLSEPFSVDIERYNDEEVEWVGSYFLPNCTRRTVTQFILEKIENTKPVDNYMEIVPGGEVYGVVKAPL